MNVEAYLKRINYHGPRDSTPSTLRALQLAHLYSVPFENLSIHNDEPIVLDEAALFDKVVTRRRGGFCYELNGLFAGLLRTLGFDVTMLSARVANRDGGFSRPFDHMALLVEASGRWLVDVGFGDAFRLPLRLDERIFQTQFGRAYRLARVGDDHVLSERKADANWQAQYRFNLRAYQFGDYEPMCRYHQTSPASHFTQKRVCTLATPDGRLTLSETHLIATNLSGDRREEPVGDPATVDRLLRRHFGVVLDARGSS